jgi:hypothetical protein
MRLHTRVIIRDGKQAFLGSQSLRKLELDSRREIGIIVSSRKVISALTTIFDDDWKASTAEAGNSQKKMLDAHTRRTSKKVAKTLKKKLAPEPVVKRVVKAIETEGAVDVKPKQAERVVKTALKKAVKKATARLVEEAVAN